MAVTKYIEEDLYKDLKPEYQFGTEFIEIDDDDIDTIGGLVVKLLGRLAEVNDKVELNNLIFVVKEVDGARITKLEIVKTEQKSEDEDTEQTKQQN